MNIAFQLFQIQEIDTTIDKHTKRISTIEDLIVNNTTVKKAEILVETKKEALIKKTNDFNTVSDDIEKKKIKKNQSQSSLYSGKVQNPKELEDLQNEIASLDKAISRLEESLMQHLVDLDKAEKDYDAAKKSFVDAKSDFATQSSLLTAEKDGLHQKIDSLNNRRSPIYAQVSENDKKLYESLRKKKRGIAVTTITDDCCSACGANLTAGQRQSARSSTTIFICPTCSRIIYGSA